MNKITLKEFWSSENKIAIHCKTEEEANELLKVFDKLGQRWVNGQSYIGINHWEEEKENTCYDNTNCTSRFKWYKANDFKIYEFEDVNLGA